MKNKKVQREEAKVHILSLPLAAFFSCAVFRIASQLTELLEEAMHLSTPH